MEAVEGSFEEATKKVAGPFDNPEDGLEQLKDGVARVSNGLTTLFRAWQVGRSDLVTDSTYYIGFC